MLHAKEKTGRARAGGTMNRTGQSLQESVALKQHALLLPTLRRLMCDLNLYYGRPSSIQASTGTGSASSAFKRPLKGILKALQKHFKGLLKVF